MNKKKAVWSVAVAWMLLVGVAFAVFYGVAMFSYTNLAVTSVETGTTRTDKYRWDDGPILIDRATKVTKSSGKRGSLACQVYPDRGEHRTITFSNSKKSRGYVTRDQWFEGSASMRCDGAVNVYSGSGYHMYLLAHSRLFLVGVAVLSVLPLAVVALRAAGVGFSDLKAALPRRR